MEPGLIFILHLDLEARKVGHTGGLGGIWIGSRWPKAFCDSMAFLVVLAELHSPIPRDVLSLTQGCHTPKLLPRPLDKLLNTPLKVTQQCLKI